MKNKFKDFLNENVKNDKNDIIKFVTSKSYFDYDGDEDDTWGYNFYIQN